MMNVTSIVPNDARNGGPSLTSSSRPSSIDKYQESPMLNLSTCRGPRTCR